MRIGRSTTSFLLLLWLFVQACSDAPPPQDELLSTKTPYAPQGDASSRERAPEGYRPAFTQLLARHGARALTSDHDLAYVEQAIALAERSGELHELGRELLPEVLRLEAANAALGYGNLSGLGIAEHRDLAARLLERLPELFAGAITSSGRIRIVTSGRDRAVDSAANFGDSLAAHLPALSASIDPPVEDQDLLYFFKLDPDYQDWLASDRTLHEKLEAIFYGPPAHRAARLLLERLFAVAFVDRLAAGALPFTDPKTGEAVTLNEVDLGSSIYALYQIAPGLREEGPFDFGRFVPRESAQWFAYAYDAYEFYQKGPSFAGETITFETARVLQDDFFRMARSACDGASALAADLRFAHAETIIPFAALMELPSSDVQVPAAATFDYADNPWRGASVSPYAANVQWDSYRNDAGDCLVRMLYNERDTRFKATCRTVEGKRFFYELEELERCYGYR